MTLLKRQHDEIEDSEEDEPSYGKQILPIANLPYDFNEEPTDGMQYLFTVRRAARQLPDVVRVVNPFKTQDAPIRPFASSPPCDQSGTRISHLPCEEWRNLFEYRFLNFRKNFNQPTIHVGALNDGSRRLMPEKKDRDMWWSFLEGKSESELTPMPKSKAKSKKLSLRGMRAWADDPPPQGYGNTIYALAQNNDEGEVEQVLREDPADTLPTPAVTPVTLEYLEEMMQPSASGSAEPAQRSVDSTFKPREPTTKLLKLIDERTALHLLMYFTHWIQLYLKAPELDNHVPTESHARWIFALLSRIDEQLSADDMNLLRNLARACLGLLKVIRQREKSVDREHNSARMGGPSCWFIVTIVADIWKQRDLWMDAEAMLAVS